MKKSLPTLTKNQSLVFETLSETGTPLSAYAILDNLRGQGLRAPVQVYRALDKLMEKGLVHRLETLNAYVACRHGHRHGGSTVFGICNACGEVSEFTDRGIGSNLAERAANEGFAVDNAIVELRGVCGSCSQLEDDGKEANG